MERLGPRRLVAFDALAAVALVPLAVFRTPAAPVLAGGLAVLFGLPLALRRRWPLPVLTVVVVAGAVAVAVGVAGDAVVFAVALALYPPALCAPTRRAGAALVGALAGVTAGGVSATAVPGLPVVPIRPGEESFAATPVPVLLYAATVIAGSWALGRAVRARRQHAAQLAELRADRAVAEERLRIARDIHDVVGHSLSVIAMRAAVANHLADSHPGQGRDALAAIERVSRAALDDVRVVLGALRDPVDTAPSFAELDRLMADVRLAGVAVDLEVAPDLSRVPAAVQASAYRIVQEALTNVLRHAGPTRCRIAVAIGPGVLTVAVVATGRRGVPWGRPATACGGCANGRRCTAAAWRPAPRPAAGSPSVPGCRSPWGCPTMSEPVRVLLADDEALLRGALRLLVDATPGMTVVAEAGTGRAAVELARAYAPDVVLMDIRMPELDGIAATEQVTALRDAPRVLILTTFDLDEYVYRALRAGASGFLLKDTPPVRLLDAIRVVAAGEALLAPSVTRRLIAEFTRLPAARRVSGRLDGVTRREREVLTLITRGMSNAEIERHLHLSRGTVKTHIGRLLTKLAARDRAQLVIAGYESGLAGR
ncbi:DNA-binding NarL/FixJ family response regulator [Micromonospora sp. M71_S20]|nr:DNA-binding NarL/FixJ family response regulator [Micromonospora sp. M71_S20]